tara:strand:+ start:1862 stop:2188 length:327 start_codon:yes stop_codon:yes gene_type:complete
MLVSIGFLKILSSADTEATLPHLPEWSIHGISIIEIATGAWIASNIALRPSLIFTGVLSAIFLAYAWATRDSQCSCFGDVPINSTGRLAISSIMGALACIAVSGESKR